MGKLIILCIPLVMISCSSISKKHSKSMTNQPENKEDCYKIFSHESSEIKKDINYQESRFKIFNRLGNCLGELGQFGESLYYYEIALSLTDLNSPARSVIYTNISNNYLATGNIELGLTTLEQALKLNPENQTALIKMGITHFHMGDLQNSIRILQSIKKPTESVLYYLAANYFFLKKPGDLSNVLEKLTDRSTDPFRLLEKAQQVLHKGVNDNIISETKNLVIENYALKMVQNHISRNYEKNGLPH